MSDECRPVKLPSGEKIRVRGGHAMSEAETKFLGEIVEAARRLIPPSDPGAAELYERIQALKDRVGLLHNSSLAVLIGVNYSVLTRIAQGRMPGDADLAKIEERLAKHGV